MRNRVLPLFVSALMLVAIGMGCSKKNESIANEKQIEDQLQMAALNNVTIQLDKDKKTAVLQGSVNTDQEKATAERIVKATAPTYQMTDNIVVQQQNATTAPSTDHQTPQNSEPAKQHSAKHNKKSGSETASE